MHIFISYAKKDTRELAFKLRDALAALPGVTAWMDESLEAGESWAWQIQQEIDRCDYVVVLLSPDVNRRTAPRSFVLNEIDYAQQENKRIIPVMAQKTKVPVQIAGIQYIDFVGDHTAGLDRLISTIARRAGISVPPVEPPVAPPAPAREPMPFTPLPPRQTTDSPLSLGERPGVRVERQVPQVRLSRRLLVALALVVLALIAGLFILPGIITPPANQFPTDILAPLEALVTRQPEIFTLTAAASSPTPTPTESVTATAEALRGYPGGPPVTANDQWIPVIQSFDSVEMVLVPTSCFMMGSQDGDNDEQPVEQQCVDQPFWIDRYEVTNEQFDRLNGVAEKDSTWTDPQRPREGITWFEARDFCASRGARLPTELEWEYAARGPDNLIYPWGNDFVADNVVYNGNSGSQTADVGSRPDGVSWVGALDMSGNVWEWVSTIYDTALSSGAFPYPYRADDEREDLERTDVQRVLRGGSWLLIDTYVRAPDRGGDLPTLENSFLGFRCARSYSETTTPIQPGFTPASRNTDWKPVIRSFDGVDMALVPIGCFMMGSENGDGDARPVKQQCINQPFWIDKTEVTNRQYGSEGYFSGDNRPREGITWFEARDFCTSRGMRLPTELEWEYAARGPDNLIYPWGYDFNADNVVYEANADETVDVGSRPGGVSWIGALDMSGNVWEWVSTIFGIDNNDNYNFSDEGEKRFSYPYNANDGREQDSDDRTFFRVERGGSWNDLDTIVRAPNRNVNDPTNEGNRIGFRCARDY